MSDIDMQGPSPRQWREPPAIPVRVFDAGCEPVPMRYHERELQSDFWRAYIADSPGLSLRCGGLALAYARQAVLVIPGWCRFRFLARPEVWHAYVHFTTPTLPAALVREIAPLPMRIADRDLADAFAAYGRRISTGAMPALVGQEALGLAHIILHRVIAGMPPAHQARLAAIHGGPIAELAAWMRADLRRPLRLRDLAARLDCCPDVCVRRFRAAYGQTPMQYLAEVRCVRAAEMLLAGGQGIPAIAEACGFPNRNYLTRVFTARFGLAPAAYRETHADTRAAPGR